MTKEKEFVQGYACCLATLIRMEGCTTTQTDELFNAGIGSIEFAEKCEVDEYDLEILRVYDTKYKKETV